MAEPIPVCRPATFSTRSQIVVASCACTAASLFVYAVDPMQHAVYPQCLLYKMTGIYCAGCGATRAVYALLHGRLLDAVHDNLLLVAALPLLFWLAITYVIPAWRNDRWPEGRLKPGRMGKMFVTVAIVVLSFMALRNAPGWPFELLRPLTH